MYLLAAALVAAIVISGPASARPASRAEVSARHSCARGHVISCIHRAALHRRVSYGTMLYIAHRESRYDPRAKNPTSTASGLFQFLTSTWFGGWNPYRHRSIWSAKWSSLAAALAMSEGHYSWWACC